MSNIQSKFYVSKKQVSFKDVLNNIKINSLITKTLNCSYCGNFIITKIVNPSSEIMCKCNPIIIEPENVDLSSDDEECIKEEECECCCRIVKYCRYQRLSRSI